MKFETHGTTLQAASNPAPLYGDFSLMCENETPLLTLDTMASGERPLLVHPDVLRTYQRIIFQLEMQVLHYRSLVTRLSSERNYSAEAPARMAEPLNTASIEILNSIISAGVDEGRILRAFDDEEP